MKKVMILFCTVIFILISASYAMADVAVSLEVLPGGADWIGQGEKDIDSDYDTDSTQTGNLSAYSLLLEGTLGDLIYGFEYGIGEDRFNSGDIITQDTTYDFNMKEYKLGARVLNLKRVKLGVTVSRLEINLKNDVNEVDMSGNLLGFDVDCNISEKISLQSYLGYSLFGSDYEESGSNYDGSFLFAFKAKLNYKVANNVALSLGFKEVGSASYNDTNSTDQGLLRGIGGFFIGASCTY